MKTPPPDKQPAGETPRDIAEDISREFGSEFELDRRDLTNAIELALRNRDERAVRIINEHQALDKCEDNCWTTIKAAIREGK